MSASSAYVGTHGVYGTPPLRYEDCVIGLPGEPKFPEPSMYIVYILRKYWDEKRSRPAPNVDLRGDLQGFDFSEPQIVVANLPGRKEMATIDAGFKNEYWTVALDIWSNISQAHAEKLIRETERVIDRFRTDTFEPEGLDPDLTGRTFLNFGERVIPYDKNTSGFWRRTAEVKLNWRFREIKEECD